MINEIRPKRLWSFALFLLLVVSCACVTLHAATFVVTNTANSGAGSLRQAILDANAAAGADAIHFAIPGSPPFSIQPLSALPTVTQPVTIDATTQPGFAGTPAIELRGDAAGSGMTGLTITGGGTTIRGFAINRFSGHGLWLETGNLNKIEGNHVGLNPAGTTALGNGQFGVVILNSSSNTIGGTTTGARNVISGNGNSGIIIQGPCWNNVIQGNFIGADAAGANAVGNGDNGIYLLDTYTNTVGGTSVGAGNLISGNGLSGIVFDWNAAWNLVQGNHLGTDVSGSYTLGRQQAGVNINPGHNNLVGGTNAAARNVISGNSLSGILIQSGSSKNLVQGNYLGLNATGAAALPNGQNGILIGDAGTNTIGGAASGAGNVISGNGLNGVEIANSAAASNIVQGNFIGTDATGNTAVGNAGAGVFISAASDNVIGGSTPAARNVLSGNHRSGVGIGGVSFRNKVQGNFIGTDISGGMALGNEENGILIYGGGDNLVGGTAAGEGNTISANGFSGVELADATSGNQVAGNFIGTDSTGTMAMGGQLAGFNIHGTTNNLIGGTTSASRNIISGNFLSGLRLWDGASGNRIQGNHIGTDVTGTMVLGNDGQGILFEDASDNQIGGATASAGNIIAFNLDTGVSIVSGSRNLIRNNSIFANGGLGIDLGANGVTANDPGDADIGANGLQNYPVLDQVLANADGGTTIRGSLVSAASATFSIEFLSNTACDPSGYGEGQGIIGLISVNTDATGSNYFVVMFTNTVPAGNFVTALATDANGNTSEFSACAQIMAAPAPPEITFTLVGNQIELSWPALSSGWRLEWQTNAPGFGITTNWFTLIEPLATNHVWLPVYLEYGSVFYRLANP